MARFRKLPVEIEAVAWNGFTCGLTNKPVDLERPLDASVRLEKPDWMPPISRVVTTEEWPAPVPAGDVWRSGDELWIGTLEGPHKAQPGDWIIRGVNGELYPCKPDIFAKTYEPVETHNVKQ